MHISALLVLFAAIVATDAQSSAAPINTATITDATGAIQTPTGSIAQVSPTSAAQVISSDGVDPLHATDAVTAINPAASTVATETLSTDLIKPTIVAAVAAQDLFAQIANDDPVQVLGGTIVNQVAPVSLDASYGGINGKAIQTNKFYGNLLNGDRTQTVFTMPYSLFWSKSSYGLCVSNAANSDYAFGPNNVSPTYYYSPIFRCPIGFSSAEMDSAQTMSLGNLQPHSVDVTFAPSSNAGKMKTTLTQGSAFISMTYTNLQPVLFSGTGAFTSLSPVTFKVPLNTNGVSKYRVTSNNGDTWLVYVFQSGGPAFSLAISSGNAGSRLLGSAGFSGTIQIAKLPAGFTSTDEAFYDSGAGTFPTTMVLTGSASGKTASYTFDYQPTSLISNPLLTYLFPHQQQSVSSGAWSDLKLWSTTKGLMRARFGNTLTFSEANLPIDIQFLPWSPLGNLQNYSAPALQAIAAAANNELKQSISQQSNLADLYFSGKALAKFAQICLAVNDVLGADASDCISRLEAATETFTSGNNQNPLRYDVTWKGAISSCGAGQTLDAWTGCGFGNPVYNDHHFHASYVVYTAAVLAHLDPSWLSRGKNKAYINTLIRDFANPSAADTAFPVFRSFDWVAGHSWAHGLLASGDGKDEESSSEDYNAYYAMKLWGKVIGDTSMEARGNLMLSIMSRSMQSYMLMAKDNTVQPANFIHNFVAGITFENKVDHTTYFGTNTEYIHGIHMLPLTPMSAFIRTPTFVAQEWDAVLKPITPQVEGTGWSGILWANLAISNSTASFNYFASPTFNSNNLDGGASLTWYLTYAAGLGGAGNFQLAVNATGGQVQTTVAPQAPSVAATTSAVSSTRPVSTTTTHATSASFVATVSGSPVILPQPTTLVASSAVTSSTISTESTSTSTATSTSQATTMQVLQSTSLSSASASMVDSSSADVVSTTVLVSAGSATVAPLPTSVPAVSSPIVSIPVVSIPVVSIPAVSIPAVSISAVSIPAVSVSTDLVVVVPSSVVVTSMRTVVLAASTSAVEVSVPVLGSTSTVIETVGISTSSAIVSVAPIATSASTIQIVAPVPSGGSNIAPVVIADTVTSTVVVAVPVASIPPVVAIPGDVSSDQASVAGIPAIVVQGQAIQAPAAINSAAPVVVPASDNAPVIIQPTSEQNSGSGSQGSVPMAIPQAGANPSSNAPTQNSPILTPQDPAVSGSSPAAVAPAGSSPVQSAPSSGTIKPTLSGTCAGVAFQVGVYACWEDKQLCPIMSGVIYQNCNGACYDPSVYTCSNGALSLGQGIPGNASGAGKLATCGSQNYNSAAYTCFGEQLCPIQGGVATQVCGKDCYNPSVYSCASGRLVLLRR